MQWWVLLILFVVSVFEGGLAHAAVERECIVSVRGGALQQFLLNTGIGTGIIPGNDAFILCARHHTSVGGLS